MTRRWRWGPAVLREAAPTRATGPEPPVAMAKRAFSARISAGACARSALATLCVAPSPRGGRATVLHPQRRRASKPRPTETVQRERLKEECGPAGAASRSIRPTWGPGQARPPGGHWLRSADSIAQPAPRSRWFTLSVMASLYRSCAGADQVRDWCSAGLARWWVPHASHEVETSCGQTHVLSAGTGDGICVFLPGTNFNAASSTVVLGALASRCRVYAADLPGQPGLSTAKRPDHEQSGYAAWLTDVIAWVRRRHQGGRIVLAGHSRGAAVALSAEPDSVEGLALLAPAGLTEVRPSIEMLRSTLPWLVRRNNAGARRLLAYMSGPAHPPADDLVEWMTLVARACRTTGAPGPCRTTAWSVGRAAMCGSLLASMMCSFRSASSVSRVEPSSDWSRWWYPEPDTFWSTRSPSSCRISSRACFELADLECPAPRLRVGVVGGGRPRRPHG